MNRQPDYEQRSASILEEASDEKALKEVREEIFKDLTQSVKTIKEFRDDVSLDARDRLKASVEHLKLAGLYVDHVKHSGKIEGVQVYIPEQDGGARG